MPPAARSNTTKRATIHRCGRRRDDLADDALHRSHSDEPLIRRLVPRCDSLESVPCHPCPYGGARRHRLGARFRSGCSPSVTGSDRRDTAAAAHKWGARPIPSRARRCDAWAMTQIAEHQTFRRVPRTREQRLDELENGAAAPVASSKDPDLPAVAEPPLRETILRSLRERHALRDAIAYVVEAPEGEIGFVTEVRIAPFAYWPDELIVEADPRGPQFRVPIETVSAVLPRQGRLFVSRAPVGARPVPPPRLTKARAWRLAGAAGAVLGLGGYVATFVALALGTGIAWGPGLAASGAIGGAAAAASWQKRGRSWPAALGLGSFWLPLVGGVIGSLLR